METNKEAKIYIEMKWEDWTAEYEYLLFKDKINVARGNREWAGKIADHYGIEVPELTND